MNDQDKAWQVIRLAAPNDVNGNPRRLLVGLFDGVGEPRIVDEGYNGDGPGFIRKAFGPYARYDGLTFKTTPGEYRSLVKRAVTP